MAFIDQEANEKAEEIDAKVRNRSRLMLQNLLSRLWPGLSQFSAHLLILN